MSRLADGNHFNRREALQIVNVIADKKLVFAHQGRAEKATSVFGEVITDILA